MPSSTVVLWSNKQGDDVAWRSFSNFEEVAAHLINWKGRLVFEKISGLQTMFRYGDYKVSLYWGSTEVEILTSTLSADEIRNLNQLINNGHTVNEPVKTVNIEDRRKHNRMLSNLYQTAMEEKDDAKREQGIEVARQYAKLNGIPFLYDPDPATTNEEDDNYEDSQSEGEYESSDYEDSDC